MTDKGRLDEFFQTEIPLTKRFKPQSIDLLCFAAITVFCIFLRVALFTHVSNDYKMFLSSWFETLEQNGGLLGIGISIGDYTPPYFYILALLTYLPIDPLISIKLVSVIFDFFLAIVIFKLVFERTGKYTLANLSYAMFLLAPTVFLNSAAWAQCDVIFVTFLVLCTASLLKNRPFSAMVFFSVAFCFKLQAIFLLPALVLFFLKGKIKLRYFLLIPVVYIISVIPSALMGRPITELLTIYFSQSGQYSKLSMNAPNPYYLLGDSTDNMLSFVGICICAVILGMLIYLLYSKQFELTSEVTVTISLLFLIAMPFFLPHMHERYFYAADVVAIIYAFYRPKRWYVAVTTGISSLLCYLPFLFGTKPISLNIAVLLMTFSLAAVGVDLFGQIFKKTEKRA